MKPEVTGSNPVGRVPCFRLHLAHLPPEWAGLCPARNRPLDKEWTRFVPKIGAARAVTR